MKRARTYRVSEVARIAGVSVRGLHHYDAISLLVAGRSAAGYRIYDAAALLRLQQILIGREFGLSLEEIRRSLDDPAFDHRKKLSQQRAALLVRLDKTQEMIRAVDRALALLDAPEKCDPMDIKDIFEGFDTSQYEEEAKQRYGHTDAYRESRRRTRRYKAEDWRAIKQEQDGIYREAAAGMKAGRRPDDKEVMNIAERHRLAIERWFYPCGFAMHQGLADLYEADHRFAANIDKYGEGLTPFLAEAIRANAARNGR